MCVSAWPTSFSRTITGTWEVLVDNRLMHVIWYQNRVGAGASGAYADGIKAQVFEVLVRKALASGDEKLTDVVGVLQVNQIDKSQVLSEVEWRKKGGKPRGIQAVEAKPSAQNEAEGNCLIIPLLGSWSSIRLLNTMHTPEILNDISKAIGPSIQARSLAADTMLGGAPGGGLVFMKFDIYDIVLAERASDIPRVLPQIVAHKRPKVNDGVFGTFDRWYGCPVAVCCFNQAESGEAKPLAFAFEPTYPDRLVVYTLDAHDGNPPDPLAQVKLDHDLFVGSYCMEPGLKSNQSALVKYSDVIPDDLKPYMVDRVLGTKFDQRLENGDVMFAIEDVRKGVFNGLRTLPHRAPSGLPRLGHRVFREDPFYKTW